MPSFVHQMESLEYTKRAQLQRFEDLFSKWDHEGKGACACLILSALWFRSGGCSSSRPYAHTQAHESIQLPINIHSPIRIHTHSLSPPPPLSHTHQTHTLSPLSLTPINTHAHTHTYTNIRIHTHVDRRPLLP